MNWKYLHRKQFIRNLTISGMFVAAPLFSICLFVTFCFTFNIYGEELTVPSSTEMISMILGILGYLGLFFYVMRILGSKTIYLTMVLVLSLIASVMFYIFGDSKVRLIEMISEGRVYEAFLFVYPTIISLIVLYDIFAELKNRSVISNNAPAELNSI